MKRSWSVPLAVTLLLPACQTAPKVPAAVTPAPELLRPYEGSLRLLPHRGDVRVLDVAAGQALAGACDVAVRVRSVAFAKGEARFSLDMLGQPKAGGRAVTCKRLEPTIQLTLSGLPAELTPDATARIDELLLTPEAYLKAKGTAFDRPPAAPTEVASRLTDASEDERRAARAVVAWPQPLLSVDPLTRAEEARALRAAGRLRGRGRRRRARLPAQGEDVPRPRAGGAGPRRAAALAAGAGAARGRARRGPGRAAARAPRLLRRRLENEAPSGSGSSRRCRPPAPGADRGPSFPSPAQ